MPRWFWLALCLFILAWRTPDYLQLWHADPAWFAQDFNYYYIPSLAYREGWLDVYWVDLYDAWQKQQGFNPVYLPAEYPPLTYLVHVPFTYMSRPDASLLYFYLTHALIGLTAAAMAWGLPKGWSGGRRVGFGVLAAALMTVAAPTMDCFYQGQMGMIQVFMVTLFCVLYLHGYRRSSAFPLAVAVSLKLTPVAFWLYLARKRDWRTLGWSAGFLVLLTLPVLLTTLTPKLFLDFFANLPRILICPQSRMNQGLGFLTTVLGPSDYGPAWIDAPGLARPLITLLSLTTLGLTLAWARPGTRRLAPELAAVAVFQIYAPVRAWPHYQVYLALVAYLLAGWPERRCWPAGVLLAWAALFSGVISARPWEIDFRYTLSTWGVPTLVMLAIWAVIVRANAVASESASPQASPAER